MNRPLIEKHGTIDCDLVETSPVVFRNRVYRLEWVRRKYFDPAPGGKDDWGGGGYFRFVDRETGEVTTPFAHGHAFGCAFAEGDTAYAVGTEIQNGWYGHTIRLFASKDLESWDSGTVLDDPKYSICNTSLCKADNRYVLMFEISSPEEETGVPFTARFATSTDLKNWEITPPECVYEKDRYTAPHCLRYHDGYYYDFYLEGAYSSEFAQCVVRSRDLIHWESSPLNPALRASDEERKIANPHLTREQREHIAGARNINNSDIDFCEFNSSLIINYSSGVSRSSKTSSSGPRP